VEPTIVSLELLRSHISLNVGPSSLPYSPSTTSFHLPPKRILTRACQALSIIISAFTFYLSFTAIGQIAPFRFNQEGNCFFPFDAHEDFMGPLIRPMFVVYVTVVFCGAATFLVSIAATRCHVSALRWWLFWLRSSPWMATLLMARIVIAVAVTSGALGPRSSFRAGLVQVLEVIFWASPFLVLWPLLDFFTVTWAAMGRPFSTTVIRLFSVALSIECAAGRISTFVYTTGQCHADSKVSVRLRVAQEMDLFTQTAMLIVMWRWGMRKFLKPTFPVIDFGRNTVLQVTHK
jgi:hypothetical protein